MPVTIGSNILSLKAQRQLQASSAELAGVFERLSSGQRINKASDDSAGLAIAETLNSSSRVYVQGVRNLNDGISLLNVADSALESLTSIVTRLTELAEQAGNSVYGTAQRKALDAEAQALSDEYFRISASTEFNGVQLFTGDFTAFNLQGGFGIEAVLALGIGGAIGNGTFSAALTSGATVTNTQNIQTADFNGDGILDVVQLHDSNTIKIMYGTGDGRFTQVNSISLASNSGELTIGDVNNDGNMDLVVATTAATTVGVMLGSGNGTFGSLTSYTTGGAGNVNVTLGDLNSDGYLDIVATSATGNVGSVFLGTGNGSFGSRTTFSTGLTPEAVKVADFNRDGVLDVMTSDRAGDSMSVYLGNGDGTFKTRTSVTFGGTPDIYDFQIADINNDGIMDFVAADANQQRMRFAFGNGDGTFGTVNTVGGLSDDVNIALVADLNGDGALDIIGGMISPNRFLVAMNRGDGTFATAVTISTPSTLGWLATGDVNNDGVVDIISGASGANSLGSLIGGSTPGVAPLLEFSLKTAGEARQALSLFQNALDRLSKHRGIIGSHLSRINVANEVLSVSSENFKAAESRIRDADIAEETSRMTRLSILQQTGAAVLAQANLQPQLAINLLTTN